MPSLHVWKAINKAADKGAYAGHPDALPLWELSKRELIEIALRLGERADGTYTVYAAVKAALGEYEILKDQNII